MKANSKYFGKHRISPYEVLGISENPSKSETKSAFRSLINNESREIRRNACLAYDMLCNSSKYNKYNKEYEVKKKDCFYYVVVGDTDSLKEEIDDDPRNLEKKDDLKRNLLYLAARNGFYDICEYLIKKGIDINETQKDGSTPLHGAAYYGHKLVVELLIDYGADINIKNNFGNLASDEAKNDSIEKIILESKNDKIQELFKKLKEKNLASRLVLVKYKEKIIAKKIICSDSILPDNINELRKSWTPVWHGTKYEFLESIIQNGLKSAGSKLANGKEINPLPGHIKTDVEVGGIKNWAKAIFVSPSLFYSAHVVYSERILSKSKDWAVLVQGLAKPGSYTKYKSTVLSYNSVKGEPKDVEYRVEENDSELIYRFASNDKNIYLTSVTFVLVHFLDNVKEYTDSTIVMNSKEEKELLEVEETKSHYSGDSDVYSDIDD